LCEHYGLRQVGRLRGQLRQLLVIPVPQPFRRTADQPGRLTRRKQAPWRAVTNGSGLVLRRYPGANPWAWRMRRTYSATIPYWP
jgi:hypothetical protein